MRIEIAGENALIVYLGEETSPRVSARVQQACRRLEAALGTKLIDLIPSYASVLIIYDPWQCDHLQVRQVIREQLSDLMADLMTDLADNNTKEAAGTAHPSRQVELPVWYSPESGPDLVDLAERAGLTPEAVIKLHQAPEYHVYAIGFAPGFAYLGQVDERIAAPRLANPRLKVPRGAVAIADRQTAVYPAVSPGGWNLIGLCPVRMFDPQANPSMPVSVGDSVRFKAIDRDEFLALGGQLP